MSLVRKLNPDRNITGAVIPLSMIPIFGVAAIVFGLQVAFYVLAGMMWIAALYFLYVFIRTGNIPHLVLCAEGVFFGVMFTVFEPTLGLNSADSQTYKAAYISGVAFFGFLVIALLVTRRLKWRGREVFELAAVEVDETGDGYTARPRPVGKVEYSPEQLRGFARFLARHLVALPYYDEHNITLTPIKMGDEYGRLLGLSGDYRDATWVNFDQDGEVSVHIAHRDYLDYREPLRFDLLCAAMGQLFIDFLELYSKGEGVRIIDRMDDLRLSVLS